MPITAVLLTAFVTLAGADTLTGVRVYVYTSTSASGQPTEEEQGRLAAVEDLRDALRKKKGLTLVTDRSQAQIQVEVTGREQREPPSGGFGGKTITNLGDFIIRARVAAGDEQTELKGIGHGTWGRAAKDAADRILKWIARHEPKKSGAMPTVSAATDPRPH
jgi:hypothetical protein